jgi:hypothetical protein
MRQIDHHVKYSPHELVALLLLLLLTLNTISCKSNHSSSMQPVIVANLDSFSTGSVPIGVESLGLNSSAYVQIWDNISGAIIPTGSVIMNGQTLTYNPIAEAYQGYINILPGDAVTLTVMVSGDTYTASGTQFASYPIITSPASNTSWSAGNSHTMIWTGGTPEPSNNGFYDLAIFDANDPNGNLVWPSDNYMRDVGLGVTSNIIPANGLSIGSRLAIAGISQEVIVSDYTSYYIDFYISGFTYVPFTIIPSPTPTNVIANPGEGQVSLSWAPVAGATSYNLYWSTTATNANKASGTQIPDVSSPALHTGLINGIPYYYVVTAVTSGDESAESTPVARAIPGMSLIGGTVQGYALNLHNTVDTLAGSQMSNGYADCLGSAARFDDIESITTDGTNVYVADSENHIIRQIVISTGEVTLIAGKTGDYGSTDGMETVARFNGPSGITTDGTNLYVADTGNHTIRQIVISTGEVSTLAGSAGLYGSTDGTGSAARFNYPTGITMDGTNLYVTDTWNHTIRKIVISTGEVSTLAGSPGHPGTTDGTGSVARFYGPHGITTDGNSLYVADTDNSTIRKIVISTGGVTTLAGQAGIVSESTDGTGTTAAFAVPTGITTDGTNLYVTDDNSSYYFHSSVRKIVISTGTTTTLPSIIFYTSPGIVTDGIELFVSNMNAVETIQ